MTIPKLPNPQFCVNMRDLQIFHVLAETLNTTTAAERLGVTQSAVSQSLARLEKWLGITLLDRSKRPIRMTYAGEVLRRGASEILQKVQQTAEDVRAGSNARIPLLRFGMTGSFAQTAGPEVVKALQQRVEQLRVWSGISPAVCTELLDRSLDVIVSIDPMVEYPELAREVIFQEALVAAVPRRLAKDYGGLSIEQMCAKLPLVRYSGRSANGRIVESYLRKCRLAPQEAMELEYSDTVMKTVASGIGWAITSPLCLLMSGAQTMDLAVLPLPTPPFYRRLYLVFRPNELAQLTSEIGRICRACLDSIVLPQLKDLAPWAGAETIREVKP